ncbi:hypothetical protein EDC94DRAFT_627492 [Helicostylum pulchrum]|nr:hypothetical protein EDC94DRAFT_627492 [Helicostylum pulchrum]
MTTPCLTRQNAFLLEANERLSPLDSFCGICFKSNDQVLIKPCTCIVRNKSYLAHKKCFLDWLVKDGYPLYCTRCKSRYNISINLTVGTKLLLSLVQFVLFILAYLAVHLYMCLNFESFTKSGFQSQYGDDTFVRVPEDFILPTFSLGRWNSSFQSFRLFFISHFCFTVIFIISFILSFLVTNRFYPLHLSLYLYSIIHAVK